MRFLRLWRQYDSIKAAVLLVALAVFLVGYCIHAALTYAMLLQTPAEYICTADGEFDSILPRLMQIETVKGYSMQKTAYLVQKDKTLNVTMLSAAYFSDAYGITENAHTVWANDAAFAAICENTDAQFQGTLDGKPFSAAIICTNALPKSQPFAAMSVNAAELHDAAELRICMTEQNTAEIEQLGLSVLNKDVMCAAEYEKKLVLLRIRFGALSAILALIGAAAFFRVYHFAEKR